MADDNVVILPVITKLDLDPERTLDGIKKENLKGFILAGYDQDGKEFFSSTYADGGDALWLAQRFIKALGTPMIDDLTVGSRIVWRWKSDKTSAFYEAWVREGKGDLVRISDMQYGKGRWVMTSEIDFRVLGNR